MTLKWQIRPEVAWGNLTQHIVTGIEDDCLVLVEELLDPVQAWMRANHVWQNRTGAAEAGLYTDLLHDARRMVGILLSHGPTIDYSVFLEYAHQGRWAVLAPTVDHWFPVVFRRVQEIVRRRTGH